MTVVDQNALARITELEAQTAALRTQMQMNQRVGLSRTATSPQTQIVWGGGDYSLLYKASDESLHNSTSWHTDSDLQFDMSAGYTYLIKGLVGFYAHGNSGFKGEFTGPSSPTRVISGAVYPVWDSTNLVWTYPLTGFTGTTLPSFTMASGNLTIEAILFFYIIFVNGSNDGTFAFKWTQATSDSAYVYVRQGSYLEYRQES